MCGVSCLQFGIDNITSEDVFNKKVLEVGSKNINGSFRSIISDFQPAYYLGIDIEKGPGVDDLCDVTGIIDKYGSNHFDMGVALLHFQKLSRYFVFVSFRKS